MGISIKIVVSCGVYGMVMSTSTCERVQYHITEQTVVALSCMHTKSQGYGVFGNNTSQHPQLIMKASTGVVMTWSYGVYTTYVQSWLRYMYPGSPKLKSVYPSTTLMSPWCFCFRCPPRNSGMVSKPFRSKTGDFWTPFRMDFVF